MTSFNGEDHVEVAHDPAYQLAEGTFGLRFRATDAIRRQGLFSKDYTDSREGGDITAFVEEGRVILRLQNAEDDVWVKTPPGSVEAGVEYHLAVTFGPNGLWVYLNGMPMAWQPEFTQGLEQNTRSMAIGANTWGRTQERPYRTQDQYVGTMTDFMLINVQYTDAQVAELAGFTPESHPNPNQAPSAIISSPEAGASFLSSQSIDFGGSGNDLEDGDLSGEALQWTSNIDGAIGSGAAFSVALSPGRHNITLTAADSMGASDSDTLAILVRPVNTGSATLKIGSGTGRPSDRVSLPISLNTSGVPVRAMQLDLTYDPTRLTDVTMGQGTGLPGAWVFSWHEPVRGSLRLIALAPEGQVFSGEEMFVASFTVGSRAPSGDLRCEWGRSKCVTRLTKRWM